MERRTRIWIGMGTALLVGSTGVERVAAARETPIVDPSVKSGPMAPAARPRIHIAQADSAGEGGPNEGGGPVLGTITEFRLSSNDPAAFAYDGAPQVKSYAALVSSAYTEALSVASRFRDQLARARENPQTDDLKTLIGGWFLLREAYLKTEAFLFYAGPVDGPGGPFPRLNAWPVDPAVIDGMLADTEQSLNFRAVARLNTIEQPVRITTGIRVLEYLLFGVDAETFMTELGGRRGQYLAALAQLLVNDLSVVNAAWVAGENNYRASVEAMDQRNALGRALNGMTALVGYEIPLRRIGAGLFPANVNFQSSQFSLTTDEDNRYSFAGAKSVYFDTGIDALVAATDADLAAKILAGFERAEAALGAMDAPYARFLAPAKDSPDRATAEAAVRALTDLARDLRQAGNRLGILVVVPGM